MDDHNITSKQDEVHPTQLAFTAIAAPPTADSVVSESHPSHAYNFDAHKAGPVVTKKELFSYYTYYAGNNGIGSFQYSNLLFQNLIYQAGFNPNVLPLGSSSCDVDPTAPCHVFWNGGTKPYTSVVLIASGLTFLSQALVFVGVGSLADYGNWNPWVVRAFSVICWAVEFGFLGVKEPGQWRTAMALYILSAITFWSSYVFFNAIFPKLSHDLPEIHTAHEDLLNNTISEEEYEQKCSMARSKVMNMSYGWNNVGFTACGALSLAALAGIGANDSAEKNNWGYSVSVAVCTGWWVLLAIPWFLWEKKRPGPPLPPGDNYLTFGFKQTWFALKQAWTLKQTFFYLIAFFLLADGIGTTDHGPRRILHCWCFRSVLCPETLQPQDKDHAVCSQHRLCCCGTLGHDRNLDDQGWVSQRLGILALQCSIRLHHGRTVLVWSGIHGRACPPRQRIHVLQLAGHCFQGLGMDWSHRVQRDCGRQQQRMDPFPIRCCSDPCAYDWHLAREATGLRKLDVQGVDGKPV